jgi:hypothetical protein
VRTGFLLLLLEGLLGAGDTLYYHEWRARLPARGRGAKDELVLHAMRDFIYAVLFGTLPWIEWRGVWSAVLAGLLAGEVILTLTDFVVEDRIRRPLGGVFAGERVMHGVMGIVYGAMLGSLVPQIVEWGAGDTMLRLTHVPIHGAVRACLTMMAVGVLASGARDLCAARGLPRASFPWPRIDPRPS